MARHHSDQLTQVIHVFIAIDVAVLALLGLLVEFSSASSLFLFGPYGPPGMLVVSGAAGAVISWKVHERAAFHLAMADVFRERVMGIFHVSIESEMSGAWRRHQARFGRISELHLYQLWIVLQVLVMGFGIALSLAALLRGST